MSAEAWPTEAAATAALDAAAKAEWERAHARAEVPAPPWEDAPIAMKNQIRNALLVIVWDALKGLPDPRRGPWSEGFSHGQIHPESAEAYLDNPYPASVV